MFSSGKNSKQKDLQQSPFNNRPKKVQPQKTTEYLKAEQVNSIKNFLRQFSTHKQQRFNGIGTIQKILNKMKK